MQAGSVKKIEVLESLISRQKLGFTCSTSAPVWGELTHFAVQTVHIKYVLRQKRQQLRTSSQKLHPPPPPTPPHPQQRHRPLQSQVTAEYSDWSVGRPACLNKAEKLGSNVDVAKPSGNVYLEVKKTRPSCLG